MSAIITNDFRLYLAKQFQEAFSETGPDVLYLFMGRAEPWLGTSEGEWAGSGSDTTPPLPIDTFAAESFHHDDLIAMKIVPAGNIAHVIRRVDWTNGDTYTMFDDTTDDLPDEVANNDYFVMNSEFNIYKCIDNDQNLANPNGQAATVEPTGTSTGITTAGSYKWKFMSSISSADTETFVTSDWIPVKGIGLGGTDGINPPLYFSLIVPASETKTPWREATCSATGTTSAWRLNYSFGRTSALSSAI